MSKRMLNIALVAPGDVAKLHIGVFDSTISTETMIYNQTVAAGSSIPLDLPVGVNRIVLVWAESFDSIANYYGSIGPVTIDESGDTPLPIQMKKFSTSFNINYSATANSVIWSSIPGALTYEVIYTPENSGVCGPGVGLPPETLTTVTALTYIPLSNCDWSINNKIHINTSVFNLTSTWSI